jgi:hypothetical protein
MRKKKSADEIKRVRRYTIGLDDELHEWLEKQAGGTAIAGAIVVILNQVRLGLISKPMKGEIKDDN